MTAPVFSSLLPAPDSLGLTAATTQTPISFHVSSAPDALDESSLSVEVNGVSAISTASFPGDGYIAAGTSSMLSNSAKQFTADDLGSTVWISNSSNPRDSGKGWIAQIIADDTVRIVRAPFAGTVNVATAAGIITVTGTGLNAFLPGDYITFNEGTQVWQVSWVDATTGFSLKLFYTGTALTLSGATINPAFSTHSSVDWKQQRFASGFSGQITVSGTAGDVTVFPIVPLSGQAISSGSTVTGITSKFQSELNSSAKIVLAGKRSSTAPGIVTSVTSDASIACSYAAVTTPVTAYRFADLPGVSDAATQVAISAYAKDVLGAFGQATSIKSPAVVASPGWIFWTATRPTVSTIDPKQNPFGVGIRVNFTELMRGYDATLNPAIANPSAYTLVNAGAISGPVPVISSVTVPAGNPSYVDLNLSSAMANGTQYRVGLGFGLLGNSGGLVARAGYEQDFVGYGPVGQVEAVQDTFIRTPVLSGPMTVPYGGPPVQFKLSSLDDDCIKIELGPSSVNAELVAGSFVNNFDGTGTVMVALSPIMSGYRVSVVATDDVANVSDESNLVSVSAKAGTVPGLDLLIRPQTFAHKEVCDRLLGDIPSGGFYLRTGFVVPYQRDPAAFRLDIVDPGLPVTIAVWREGTASASIENTFIPQNLVETVFIKLGRGRNLIFVSDGIRNDMITVSATTYATVLCAAANELYNYATVLIEETSNSIYGELSTRLAEPYLDFADILPAPAVQSQKTLATKLAIRSFVSDPGTADAVRDVVVATTLQTPVIQAISSPKKVFRPGIERLATSQEAFGGFDLNIWQHNSCVSRWSAFIRHMQNAPERILPVSISENEIIIQDQYGVFRRANYRLDDPLCSTLPGVTSCLEPITIKVGFKGNFKVPVCGVTYPFDSCFSYEYPLGGRASFDSMIPMDTESLDHDRLDPGHDGWVGFCWSDRWDSGVIVPVSPSIPAGDGSILAGTGTFTSAAFTSFPGPLHQFSAGDVGRWVRIKSGTRQGLYEILNILSPGSVRLQHTFPVSESVDWELVENVSALDSTGSSPDYAVAVFVGDGISLGATFTSPSQYVFTTADIGRNLRVMNSQAGYVLSLIVTTILSPHTVAVSTSDGVNLKGFSFPYAETGLDWELWDNSLPSCVWSNGYSTKAAILNSADVSVPVNPVVTMTAYWDHEAALGANMVYGVANLSGSANMTGLSASPPTDRPDSAIFRILELPTPAPSWSCEATLQADLGLVVNDLPSEVTEWIGQSAILCSLDGGTAVTISDCPATLTGVGWMWADGSVDRYASASWTGTASLTCSWFTGVIDGAAALVGEGQLHTVLTS